MQRSTSYFPDLCSVFSLLVLMLLAILTALVVTLLRSGLPEFDFTAFALAILFTSWTTLVSAALLCNLSSWLDTRSMPVAMGLALALVLGVVAAVTVAAQWWAGGAFYGSGNWAVDGYRVVENVLIASILGGVALRYAAINRQLRLREQSELTARLDALQSRIKPHFLFNSLNSVASLIDHAPADAEQAVLDLAALFRASLSRQETLVSWRQERTLCEQYLRIEQLRLGERLQVHWSTELIADDFKLPALSVQPLLENAIVHGIQQRAESSVLEVSAQNGDGVLELLIANPLPTGRDVSDHDGSKMAVENIRHRLQACYGAAADLVLGAEGSRFVARLRLPMQVHPR